MDEDRHRRRHSMTYAERIKAGNAKWSHLALPYQDTATLRTRLDAALRSYALDTPKWEEAKDARPSYAPKGRLTREQASVKALLQTAQEFALYVRALLVAKGAKDLPAVPALPDFAEFGG